MTTSKNYPYNPYKINGYFGGSTSTGSSIPNISVPNINVPTFIPGPPNPIYTHSTLTFPAVGQVWSIPNSKDPSKLDFLYIIRIRDFTDSSQIQRTVLGFIEKNSQTEEWNGPFEVLCDVFNDMFVQYRYTLDLSDNLVLREILSDVTSYCVDGPKRRKIIIAVLATSTSDLILEESLNESEKLYMPYGNKPLPK